MLKITPRDCGFNIFFFFLFGLNLKFLFYKIKNIYFFIKKIVFNILYYFYILRSNFFFYIPIPNFLLIIIFNYHCLCFKIDKKLN